MHNADNNRNIDKIRIKEAIKVDAILIAFIYIYTHTHARARARAHARTYTQENYDNLSNNQIFNFIHLLINLLQNFKNLYFY